MLLNKLSLRSRKLIYFVHFDYEMLLKRNNLISLFFILLLFCLLTLFVGGEGREKEMCVIIIYVCAAQRKYVGIHVKYPSRKNKYKMFNI